MFRLRKIRRLKRLKAPLICLFFIFLALLLFPAHPARAESPILIERGENFEFWKNADGSYTWTSAPTWIFDGSAYVPYIYERDEAKKCYRIQTALILAEIYDSGYAAFYDPDTKELRVKSEIWELWGLDKEDWKKASISSPNSISVSIGSVKLSVIVVYSTSKPDGILTVVYNFYIGGALKHDIYWTSSEPVTVIPQVKQIWSLDSSITKIKVKDKEVSTSGVYNYTEFVFGSNAIPQMVYEDQRGAADYVQPTKIDFSGKKVTFTFAGWTLAPNESLVIDPTTVTKQVGAGANDGWWEPESPGFYSTGSDMYVVGYSYTAHDWFRFTSINVPQGVTINSAYLKLRAAWNFQTSSADVGTRIQAFDEDNPSAPSSTSDYQSRPQTSAYVDWTPSGWAKDAWYTSPDIKTVIQEIFDRDEWISGNAMVICPEALGKVSSTIRAKCCYAYESGAGNAAKLEITYTPNPINDACDATSTWYIDVYGWVNMTVTHPSGVAALKEVKIQIFTGNDAEDFTLNWTQSSNTFAEVEDSSGICTLDAGTSVRVNIDSDTDKICFYFMMTTGATKGACDVEATSTDDDDNQDVDTYTSKFTLANSAPTIGEFQAPATVTSDTWFLLNATIQDKDGVDDFDYAQVELSNDVILKWKRAGNVFNVQSDPNWYVILDVEGCVKEQLNSTAYKISWRIQLTFLYPAGSVDVVAANTKVVDEQAASGSNSQTGLFTFQKGTTYSEDYGPYSVESSGSLSEEGTWASWNGTLIVFTTGNIHITDNPYGEPEWLKVDGEDWPSGKWHYFPSTDKIVIREVASKVEVHWRTFVYTFHGPYDEEDGTYWGPVDVRVYSFYGESQTFNLNSTSSPYQLNMTYQPLCFAFQFPLERRIYPIQQEADYWVLGNNSISYIYSLTVKDLGNFIDDATYMEACRYINGTLRVVERRPVDVVNPVTLTLQYMSPYRIILRSKNKDQIHIIDITADDEVEKILVISGIDFTDKVKLAYKYIRIEAFRETATKIKINYEDTMQKTISAYFEIEFMNGTEAWNGTLTADSGSLTWTEADAETDYRVKATIDHEVLHGSYLEYETYVPAVAASGFPFDLSALGTFPIPSHNVFPMLLIVFVACCFSALTAGVGIVITVIMAGIFQYIGLMEIPSTAITLAISLAILFSVAQAKRRRAD